MNKKLYRVRGIDVDHEGKRYPEGSEITLDDQAAAPLRRWLDFVAVVLPEEPAAAANTAIGAPPSDTASADSAAASSEAAAPTKKR